MSKLIFETKRTIVRQYTLDDLQDFFRINSDKDVMRYIRKPKTFEETQQFLVDTLEYYNKYPQLGRWAAYENITGAFIGSVAIIPIPGTEDLQLGYAFLKEHWGKGYATELAEKGVEYARSLKIDPLYGVVEKPNIASQKVLLKNGFEFIQELEEDGKQMYKYKLKQ